MMRLLLPELSVVLPLTARLLSYNANASIRAVHSNDLMYALQNSQTLNTNTLYEKQENHRTTDGSAIRASINRFLPNEAAEWYRLRQ